MSFFGIYTCFFICLIYFYWFSFRIPPGRCFTSLPIAFASGAFKTSISLRIASIFKSRAALSSAHFFKSAVSWSEAISFLYFNLCSRLAQKSIAIVRSCTSTFIIFFLCSKKIGTSTIRCRLR